MPYSHWCIRMPGSVGCVRRILTYRRGAFGVARFDYDGQFLRASDCEASNKYPGFTSFLCLNENQYVIAVFVAHAVFYF